MKTASFWMTVIAMIALGCGDKQLQSAHHDHDEIQTLAFTLYSEKTELFVEFKPLVLNEKTNFAAHFTILGDRFVPLQEAKITASLILGNNGIRNTADTASSPGIFRLALIPKTVGVGKLVFDITTKEFTDQFVIDSVQVYENEQQVKENQINEPASDDVSYLKEQAWKIDFANTQVKKTTFYEIIKTSGEILAAPGDEMLVTANARGVVKYIGQQMIVGSYIEGKQKLFSISGAQLAENNSESKYVETKSNLEKAKADYERLSELAKDKIVSEAALLQAKNVLENAQMIFNTLSKHYSGSSQLVSAPQSGYLKHLAVQEGQFVEAGTTLAIIAKNKKLILQAMVSQKYFPKLKQIQSATFKTAGEPKLLDTKLLNSRLVSFGRSTTEDAGYLPIHFEIDNIGTIIPGSVAEVYLRTNPISNVIVIPISAIIEEQGYFYVYVQTAGESFQKREVKIGSSDGENVQVISGITEGERVVTKGAFQIKLSSASGKLPAHGHEH